MPDKTLLLCLFAYNRPAFLMNAVESIDRHFHWGDRLVIDDGSANPEAQKVLALIARRPGWKVEVRERSAERPYGSYYSNMRFGLERALSAGYDYCFFFEDDEQFVWTKPDYPEYVERFFARAPDAVQLMPLMFRRIIPYAKSLETGGRNLEYIAEAGAYRSDRGFSTTAIWNLEVVRRYPDYRFYCTRGDDLNTNSGYWMDKGYRVYLQVDPTVAVLPWVNSMSAGAATSDRNRPATNANVSWTGTPLLRGLNQDEILYISERDPSRLAFQEYFSLSPANCTRPIWHQNDFQMERYYFLCRYVLESEAESGGSPPRIPVLPRWEPTRIAPSISHTQAFLVETKGREDPGTQPTSMGVVGKSLYRRMVPKTIRALRPRVRLRDYVGYLRMIRQLRRETAALQFTSRSAN